MMAAIAYRRRWIAAHYMYWRLVSPDVDAWRVRISCARAFEEFSDAQIIGSLHKTEWALSESLIDAAAEL